jgi:23S rRNA pseudouridine1911/1915/1917 synthase
MTPRVLRVDNHLLFLEKPAGMPTVPDESGDESLLDWAKAWVAREYTKPGAVFLGVVHRLDRPVSGVVLFARTSKAAARLSEQFRARTARKRYLGVGQGRPRAFEGELSQWLLKDEAARTVRVVAPGTRQAREAVTRWKVLSECRGRTLLLLEPLTGRAHQLRVAVATLGTPLVGDVKYGAPRGPDERALSLHAFSLRVAHPTRGEPLEVRSMPQGRTWDDFSDIFGKEDRFAPERSD